MNLSSSPLTKEHESKKHNSYPLSLEGEGQGEGDEQNNGY